MLLSRYLIKWISQNSLLFCLYMIKWVVKRDLILVPTWIDNAIVMYYNTCTMEEAESYEFAHRLQIALIVLFASLMHSIGLFYTQDVEDHARFMFIYTLTKTIGIHFQQGNFRYEGCGIYRQPSRHDIS